MGITEHLEVECLYGINSYSFIHSPEALVIHLSPPLFHHHSIVVAWLTVSVHSEF